jgi:hypothetical protein
MDPTLGLRDGGNTLGKPLTAEVRDCAHVGFVVDKVVLGELFFPFIRFYPVNIVPSELRADI